MMRISFGRVESVSAMDALLALTAALLWHFAAIAIVLTTLAGYVPYKSADLLIALGWRYRTPDEVIAKNLFILAVVLAIEFLSAYVFWFIARARQTKATAPAYFTICAWRSCLLGSIVIPMVTAFSFYVFASPYAGLALGVLYLLVAPAALSPRVLPTRQRWRPACPECGHTVAYAVLPRCSECGEPYPSADRFYRRWAVPRVPWEKTNRSWFFAYFQTVFLILFRPSTAAWRLGTPGRMGRAVRWASFHLVVSFVVCFAMLFLLGMRFGFMSLGQVLASYPKSVVPADPLWNNASTDPQVIVRFWLIATVVFPICVGLCLSAWVPRIQPAARRGLYKWTLYTAIVPICVMMSIVVVLFIPSFQSLLHPVFAIPLAMPRAVAELMSSPYDACKGMLTIYSVWWSIGVASQPYFRRRGFGVFLIALLAYTATWMLFPILFDIRGLGGLL